MTAATGARRAHPVHRPEQADPFAGSACAAAEPGLDFRILRASTHATPGLTAAERLAIEEEERLLAAVQGALAPRHAEVDDQASLESRLRDLREEALEATPKDLPTVFQEMGVVRAVMERSRGGDRPDPRAPYFAHLRLREGSEARDICLGRAAFFDREAGVRVVDWRTAPVAGLFYRTREGDDFEEPLPGRTARGVVEVRRVVVIDGGRLARIAGGALNLVRGADGTWRRAGSLVHPGGGAGRAARAGAVGMGQAPGGAPPTPT